MNTQIEKYRPLTMQEVCAFAKLNASDKEKLSYDERWLVYSLEIVNLIAEYEATGKYPYNREVEKYVAVKLFPEFVGAESEYLSNIVYNCQSYKHDKAKHDANQKMLADGWLMLTPETWRSMANETVYDVVLSTALGESKIIKQARLINNNNTPLWLPPRAKRKGYVAEWGQFFKRRQKKNA